MGDVAEEAGEAVADATDDTLDGAVSDTTGSGDGYSYEQPPRMQCRLETLETIAGDRMWAAVQRTSRVPRWPADEPAAPTNLPAPADPPMGPPAPEEPPAPADAPPAPPAPGDDPWEEDSNRVPDSLSAMGWTRLEI